MKPLAELVELATPYNSADLLACAADWGPERPLQNVLGGWQVPVVLGAVTLACLLVGWSALVKAVVSVGLRRAGLAVWAMCFCDVAVGMLFFEPRIIAHRMVAWGQEEYLATIAWNFLLSSIPSAAVILWLRPRNVAADAGLLRLGSILVAVILGNYLLASLAYVFFGLHVHE